MYSTNGTNDLCVVGRKGLWRSLWCILLLITIFPSTALAGYLTYELEGQILSPIYDSTYGRETFTGYYYAQFINRGDLKMVIDNSTGRLSITGRTYGCVVASGTNCTTKAKDKFSGSKTGAYNVNYGWGYFDWNLYMTGGRGAYGTDDDNPIIVFENMDPDIGYVQVVNADPTIKEFIGVGAKYSSAHGYSLAVLDGANENDGFVTLTSWLLHQYGVLGGYTRAESDRNSTVGNTWLNGYLVSPPTVITPPPPPPKRGAGASELVASWFWYAWFTFTKKGAEVSTRPVSTKIVEFPTPSPHCLGPSA